MSTVRQRWSFALQRRWFVYLGMAIVFATACGFLSHWQFGRNAQTVALNTLVTANYAAKAEPVATLLPSRSAFSTQLVWRRVSMSGEYLPRHQLLVRERSMGSNPGFEVLTPFREANGGVFLIDRGWVPDGQQHTYPDYIPPAPTGTEQVVARLQASEPVIAGKTSPRGQIAEINLPTVVATEKLKNAYTGAYGQLVSETPKPASRPVAFPKPVIDNGPFLSYAFQWILFAIMGFGGLAWALRQEYRKVNANDPVVRERAAARARRAALREPSDADIEDAEIAAAARNEAGDPNRSELIDAG